MDTIENCFYEKIQDISKRGIPDLFICVNGYFAVLELKKDFSAKTDDLQLYKLNKFKKAGGYASVATPETWPGIFKYFKKLSKQRRAYD